MNKVSLTKSQKLLYDSWTGDYNRILNLITNLLNDNLNLRLERLADELGIDLENGKWTFNHMAGAFEEVAEGEGTFPGEAMEEPSGDTIEAEVVGSEPEK